MSSFKERLDQEKLELSEKVEKLSAFIDSENFQTIDAVQMSLLYVQLSAMRTYEEILEERILWLEAVEEAEQP